jgi:hypothetical protein
VGCGCLAAVDALGINVNYWQNFQFSSKKFAILPLFGKSATTPTTMRFQKMLKHLVDTNNYRLTDLSKRTGIHSSDLSKMVNGKRMCGNRMIASVLDGLKEEHAVLVLIAWLQDQVPPQHQHLVHIVRADPAMLREGNLDVNTFEGAMQLLEREADRNESVRTLLMNLAKTFGVN